MRNMPRPRRRPTTETRWRYFAQEVPPAEVEDQDEEEEFGGYSASAGLMYFGHG